MVPMSLNIRTVRSWTILELTGELDLATSPQLEAYAAKLIGGGTRRLILDLSGVTFLDSSGLRALLRIHKLSCSRDGTMRVVLGGQPQLRRLLQSTGLASVFVTAETVEGASRRHGVSSES
jgi:anti-sigma B factor antagonist